MNIIRAKRFRLNVRSLMLITVIAAISLASYKYYIRWKFYKNEATNCRNLAVVARTSAMISIENASIYSKANSTVSSNMFTQKQITKQLHLAVGELDKAIFWDEQAQKFETLMWFSWFKTNLY